MLKHHGKVDAANIVRIPVAEGNFILDPATEAAMRSYPNRVIAVLFGAAIDGLTGASILPESITPPRHDEDATPGSFGLLAKIYSKQEFQVYLKSLLESAEEPAVTVDAVWDAFNSTVDRIGAERQKLPIPEIHKEHVAWEKTKGQKRVERLKVALFDWSKKAAPFTYNIFHPEKPVEDTVGFRLGSSAVLGVIGGICAVQMMGLPSAFTMPIFCSTGLISAIGAKPLIHAVNGITKGKLLSWNKIKMSGKDILAQGAIACASLMALTNFVGIVRSGVQYAGELNKGIAQSAAVIQRVRSDLYINQGEKQNLETIANEIKSGNAVLILDQKDADPILVQQSKKSTAEYTQQIVEAKKKVSDLLSHPPDVTSTKENASETIHHYREKLAGARQDLEDAKSFLAEVPKSLQDNVSIPGFYVKNDASEETPYLVHVDGGEGSEKLTGGSFYSLDSYTHLSPKDFKPSAFVRRQAELGQAVDILNGRNNSAETRLDNLKKMLEEIPGIYATPRAIFGHRAPQRIP